MISKTFRRTWGRTQAARGNASRSNSRGFSLIEITVVLAIMGMMVTVGFPAMQEWLERYRTRNAASEIAAVIQLQRMRAVSQNTSFSIAFNDTDATYTLFQGDPATGTMLDVIPRPLPFGVTYSGGGGDPINIPSDEIIFHPDGSLNDSTATTDDVFVGNAAGDVYRVTMNRATGRVQVEHTY